MVQVGPENYPMRGLCALSVGLERCLHPPCENVLRLAGLNWQVADQPMKVYCGFDPTADSLHLVSLHS